MREYDERPDWNMAIAHLQMIDRSLEEVRLGFMEGNPLRTYRGLTNCVRLISWKITEEGHEEKEAVFFKSLDRIKEMLKIATQQTIRASQYSLSNVEDELEKAHTHLMELLFEYDLLGMKKKGLPAERAIEDAF